ncbi:uncharacterized protein LOC134197844 [Corticium candelabrum]|uniref:uncharacterized protein LOC134197844 n=1 Tax=Corticium candelabrum TaxID=121492 RepID=UPI002E26D1A7|nr:uncharacterized protein LOC134197844 [Corticium candelabrum]
MDFHAIQDVCHGDDANGKVLQFMQRHHLVSSHEDCVCGTPMNIQIFLWRRRLHMEVSKNGLQGNKAYDDHMMETCESMKLCPRTGVQVFQYIRGICTWRLLHTPIQLGGAVGIHHQVCQIDESCFSHKLKHHRGHPPRQPVWVFGIVETSHFPALWIHGNHGKERRFNTPSHHLNTRITKHRDTFRRMASVSYT